MKRGDRPRMGYAPSLKSDPRDRQNNHVGVGENDIAAPLKIDAQGRATIDVAGPLTKTPDGKLDVHVTVGLSVRTGSPKSIGVNTSRTIVTDEQNRLQANIGPGDIRGLEQYIRALVLKNALDISYSEVLVADTGGEPPLLYSEGGIDVVVSEIIR